MATRVQLKDYSGGNLFPISTENMAIESLSLTSDYNTDIIATARNYILRETTEDSVRYFYYSNDCGKTWAKEENTIGDITFVHFFSNGTVLLCSNINCYTTTDFVTFTQSSVYDYNGDVFIGKTSAHSFFRLGNYASEYHELDGHEVLIWNDYNTNSGYVSRVWMSMDYGATIRCILKEGVTKDTDSQTISARHFHRVWLEDEYGILWVTSGDTGTECRLTKGTYFNSSWTWETIGTPGSIYKLSQIVIKRPYAYFVTDYTTDIAPTGLVICPVDSLDDPSSFRYLYKTDYNEAMSKWFEDANGNKILLGDAAVYNSIWFAKDNYDFKKIHINYTTKKLALGNIIGPNYLGQVVCFYNPSSGYGSAGNQYLTTRSRILLSDWLHAEGVSNFGCPQNIIGNL